MADPKLVEALAELVAAWSQKCPIDHVETTVANDIRHDCQKFFDRHNLVQLPEEPSGWTDSGWASFFGNPEVSYIRVFAEPQRWMDNVPIYIIPGDPQEVDDG